MSNQAVGSVYQSIIEDVINSSRVDFEESGVDDSVLEELRKASTPPLPLRFLCRRHSLPSTGRSEGPDGG